MATKTYTASLAITGQATAPYVICALRGPTSGRAYVRSIEVFALTAPTTSLGLTMVRSTAQGTGTFTANAGLPRDIAEPNSTALLGATWATARPTIGAASTYGRRSVLNPAIGSAVMWDYDPLSRLVVPTSAAANADLCLVQTTATASGDLYVTFIWEE